MKFHLADNQELLQAGLEAAKGSELVGLDCETTGLAFHQNHLIGISFSTFDEAWYAPFRHAQGKNLPTELIHHILEELCHERIVGHNLGFDLKFFHAEGWEPALHLDYFDSQVAVYCLEEYERMKLEECAKRHLGFDAGVWESELKSHLAELLGRSKVSDEAKAEMYRLCPTKVVDYACADAILSARLLRSLVPKLKKDKTWRTFGDLMAYQKALNRMEVEGVPVLPEIMRANWKSAEEEAGKLRERIKEESAGLVENPNSQKQLLAWLGPILGITNTKKDTLKKFFPDEEAGIEGHPAAALVCKYRKYVKAVSTYYKAMAENVGEGTTLYPSFKLTGAAVRLSAENPNTQAIPKKSEGPYRIKEFIGFPEDDDRLIIEADLSGAEIYMGYHYTGDETLRKILQEGLDPHNEMVRLTDELFDLKIDRQMAKATNFACNYGAGAGRLNDMLDCGMENAEKLHATHRNLYPDTHKMSRKAVRHLVQRRFIKLWSGRKRHLGPGVKEHAAWNNLLQGGVSEQMREIIVRIDREVPEFRMGLTVHDSIVGWAYKKDVPELADKLKDIMGHWPWMRLPSKADVEAGSTWASVVKV